MHSSSRLFPVSLMRAEFAGNLNEDVYLLNPRISSDPTLRVAVTRVTDPAWEGSRRPIVLLHSEFHNRRQWLTPEGGGFAARLAQAGFDVWLPEMRGHGLSPAHDDWAANRLSAIALEDWPALQAFITEQSGTAPFWLGLGLGGLSLCYALIHAPSMTSPPGLILVDSATRHWANQMRQLGVKKRWLISRRGYVDGQALGWGVEREPWALFNELREWQRLGRSGQHPVWDHLRAIKARSLVIGVRDLETQVRSFQGRLGGARKELLVFHANPRRPFEGPLGAGEVESGILGWLDQDYPVLVPTRQCADADSSLES